MTATSLTGINYGKKNILLLPLFGHFNTLTERERDRQRQRQRERERERERDRETES